MLLATHGTMVYYPNPVDLWRWTGAGLERLFRENGDWGSVTVSCGSGTASPAMLNAIYLEHVLRRTPFRSVRGPVVSVLNRVWALDRRVTRLRDERPGTLAANYHVVAESRVTRVLLRDWHGRCLSATPPRSAALARLVDPGPRHRRCRVHRLEPRRGPPRARRRRARARQLLDGQPREPRRARPRGRGRRGRPAVRTSACTRPCAAWRWSSTRARSALSRAPCRGLAAPRRSTSRARSCSSRPATRGSGGWSRRRPRPSTATGSLPAGRDAGAEPDLPVRGREARRRAVLRQLHARLRDRDRGPQVLQRVRAAPGPRLRSTRPWCRGSSARSRRAAGHGARR